MTWLLRSIGVTDDLVQSLDKASLAFQRPLVLWLGLLLLIPIAYYIYRRQRDLLTTVPKPYRVALSATRVFIVAMLVLVLSGPYLKLDERISKKPILAVLVDASQSMRLPAGPFEQEEQLRHVAAAAGYDTSSSQLTPETQQAVNRMARADLAHTALRAASQTVFAPLTKDYDVRYYTFARRTVPLALAPSESEQATPNAPVQGDSASHIGEAIYHVLEEAAGTKISGVMLFSDGQNTGGRSPSQAARAAADVRAPVFVTPLGSNQPVQDVSIVDVFTPGLVAMGDTVNVHVTLESQGFDTRPIKVELKDGEQLLDTKEIVARNAEQQQVELTFRAQAAGPRYLTIHVPPLAEETEELKANNTDAALVRVSEEKLKVLLLDGLPRWDFRFLKNAIRRDNGLAGRTGEQPEVVLEAEWRRSSGDAKAAALPSSVEQWAEYHTVILGDVTPELLTPPVQEQLIEAVREKGVGLIVAAGNQAMPHRFGTQFHSLLPVRMNARATSQEAPAYSPFQLEISPEGMVHETMRLHDDPGRNQGTWSQMPPYYWCAAVERIAPGGSILAWNPTVTNRYGKMPLVAYQFAGEGKVLFVGTDSTWLWRQNVGDRFFYKFWGQAIRFVSRKDESEGKKSWIEVRPVRAQAGEEAQVELMAVRIDGSPEEAKTRIVTLLGPGSRQTVELVADPFKKGRYTGTLTPEQHGVHRIIYQPENGPETQATLHVLTSPEEFRHPNVDRMALESLASATGGAVLELSELKTIPDKIKGEIELKHLHREATLWDNWLVLCVLMTVYSVDVGIRRLMGLS